MFIKTQIILCISTYLPCFHHGELTASEVEKSKAREENKPNFYKKKNARRNVTKGSDVKLLRGVGFSISRSGPDQ